SQVTIESSSPGDGSSITKFIYLSTFTRTEENEDNASEGEANAGKKKDVTFEVIPILILDQFEEIFSLNFEKRLLEKFLNDLADLIEGRIPDLLKTELRKEDKDNEYDKLVSLKNRLENSNKWYRVVFSFREEYLPRFQSLKNKIPSVFYTKGKLYLETFPVKEAARVIEKIAMESIPLETIIIENLAATISKKDSEAISLKEEVQPFMLSLVCKNIYPKLVGGDKDEAMINDVLNQDESLVERVVSGYFKKVFGRISWRTKRFVEEKLITDDDKRTMKAFNDIKSESIRKDVTELWTNPELRYLNEVEYFGAPHVEILHDRLVKPLLKSRDSRRFWEKLLMAVAVFVLLVVGIYSLNNYLVDAKTKREASTSFFHKLNPKVLQALLKDSLNSPVSILDTVITYRDDLRKFPQFQKTEGVFSDLDDSIAIAFKSLYLFDRHKADQQEHLSPNGIYRLIDSLNNFDTLYTQVQYLTDHGYVARGYIHIQPDRDAKTGNVKTSKDSLSFSITPLKISQKIVFWSDSIVQIESGNWTRIFNLNKGSVNDSISEIIKVDKAYPMVQSADRGNLFELRKGSAKAKNDTVIVHQLLLGKKTNVLLPRDYVRMIFTSSYYGFPSSESYTKTATGYEPPRYYVLLRRIYYLNNRFYILVGKETYPSLTPGRYAYRKYVYDLNVFPALSKKTTLIDNSDYEWIFRFSDPYFFATSFNKFFIFEVNDNGISTIRTDSTNFSLLKVLLIDHGQRILKIGRTGTKQVYDTRTGKDMIVKSYDTLIRKADSLKSYGVDAFLSDDQSKLLFLYYDYFKGKTQYYLELTDLNTMTVKGTVNVGESISGFNFRQNGIAMLIPSLAYGDLPITDWYYNYTPPYRFSELDSFYRVTLKKK
ncbi:MAG TPA: hypothetical protein VFI06_08825, partial [Chitinophagaceae bacterium]|nr:hypothetical protein [Chitinophagaceae bacterium]